MNRRVKNASEKQDYTKASYYYADHMLRKARRTLKIIEQTRYAVDF